MRLATAILAPQGVSVFLDGVRVNEPDAQEVNFDLLPMEAVESAELLSGPSAVFGKNSLAGSIQLRTTRGGAAPQFTGQVGIGAFGEREAHLRASGMLGETDGLVLVAALRTWIPGGSRPTCGRAPLAVRLRVRYRTCGSAPLSEGSSPRGTQIFPDFSTA